MLPAPRLCIALGPIILKSVVRSVKQDSMSSVFLIDVLAVLKTLAKHFSAR